MRYFLAHNDKMLSYLEGNFMQPWPVTRFAENLDHPRWLYLLPNGDVLVAESSTKPQEGGGIMGWIRNRIQRIPARLARWNPGVVEGLNPGLPMGPPGALGFLGIRNPVFRTCPTVFFSF